MIHTFKEFLPGALAAFSDREFDAQKDLQSFLKTLGLDPDRVCTLDQLHGADVLKADAPFVGRPGDALVTNEKNLALAIRTADCASIFLWDRVHRAIGLAHTGWRGAKKRVLENTLKALQDSFASRPENILAAVGPAICRHCYEVGAEFESHFPGRIERRGNRYFFDLAGELKSQLIGFGLLPGAIIDSCQCTACKPDRFFSARREGPQTGRLISVIVLK